MADDDVTTKPAAKKPPARRTKSAADDSLEKGYIGTVPDENPNSAYSLQSGPDSPPLVPDNKTAFNAPPAPPKENTDA